MVGPSLVDGRGHPAGREPAGGGPVGFRDPAFLDACRIARALWQERRSPARLLHVGWRERRRLPPAFRALTRLPRLSLALSSSPEGVDIERKLRGRCGGVPNRVALAVLAIPEEPEHYLVGRSRQALRTNCTRARQAGVTCRASASSGEAQEQASALLRRRGQDAVLASALDDIESGRSETWLAETAGETVALALTTTDRSLSRLELLFAAAEGGGQDARYLLSAHVVQQLSRRRVRHLVVETVLLDPPGLRHFQQRLGFTPMHVRLGGGHLEGGGRRGRPMIRGR